MHPLMIVHDVTNSSDLVRACQPVGQARKWWRNGVWMDTRRIRPALSVDLCVHAPVAAARPGRDRQGRELV
jgi:hypothetical protein